MKHQVRVCTNINCCQRGSKKIYETLKQSFSETEAHIETTENCFRFCKSGPNIAVDGAVLHHISPANAAARVREAVTKKTVKKEAVGTRSIDELDDVLDELIRL
jgi:NADH:ubiquinone oxidoreductase subunit E